MHVGIFDLNMSRSFGVIWCTFPKLGHKSKRKYRVNTGCYFFWLSGYLPNFKSMYGTLKISYIAIIHTVILVSSGKRSSRLARPLGLLFCVIGYTFSKLDGNSKTGHRHCALDVICVH